MAIRKIIIRPPGGDYGDELHPKTTADHVVAAGATTVQADLTALNLDKHNHSNKAILDATTASFLAAEKTKLGGIETNANKYVHPGSGTNPHGTTKADVGLGNADNKSSATIRGEITSANVTTALGYTPINSNLKGAINGVAELDASGKVPTAQLPSYVDDVMEFTNKAAFPATGEADKIYVDKATNIIWRWGGSAYVEISSSLALGTTSATAFRGDYGNTAYTHSQAAHAPSNAQKNSDITKAEIEAKLTGAITTHSHVGLAPAAHASTHITGGIDVIPTFTSAANGLVPASGGNGLQYLSADGTFKTINIPPAVTIGTTKPTNGSLWFDER